MQKLGANRPTVRKVSQPRFGTPEISVSDIHLEKKLGTGCFGTVWKGTCFQNPVAIKIPTIQDLTKKQLDSFRREVEIMSSNPHPNIVLFMGACTVPGQFRIVTELMDGDLETLLHSNEQLSLYERMKMAKDAALGMNWLHRSTPAIIHRDLKTANLLIEKVANKYRVKLCDFGLSEIKPSPTAYLQDGRGGAKGTPLWMPPEVMRGQRFDEKSDVYSFGIVLWEILTRKDPFPHHDDYDAFTEAVCDKNERPPIPDNCPVVLRALMQDCWKPQPSDRPDFEEINNQLDIVLVHAAIADPAGRRFWEQNFLKDEEVDGEEFLKMFYSFLKLEMPTDIPSKQSALSPYVTVVDASAPAPQQQFDGGEAKPISRDIIKLRCLKELIFDLDKSGKAWVNVEKFGQILNWFGPLTQRKESDTPFLDRIVNILGNEWFHGDIPTQEAQRRLSKQMPGCYLVRFSTNPSHPGCYTISRVSSTGQIAHIRISHVPGEGFSVNDDHTYGSLEELITKLSVPLDLRYPCSGSKYTQLVAGGANFGGYESVVGHEEKGTY